MRLFGLERCRLILYTGADKERRNRYETAQILGMGYGLFDEKEVQLTSAVADGKDKGLLDLVGGLKIYPVIRVNLFFKIF